MFRWPRDGDAGRTSRRWIMKSCHEVCDITMTRISYRRLEERGRYWVEWVLLMACSCSRYVYRFVCDMQNILGQTPQQFFARMGIIPQGINEDDWLFVFVYSCTSLQQYYGYSVFIYFVNKVLLKYEVRDPSLWVCEIFWRRYFSLLLRRSSTWWFSGRDTNKKLPEKVWFLWLCVTDNLDRCDMIDDRSLIWLDWSRWSQKVPL